MAAREYWEELTSIIDNMSDEEFMSMMEDAGVEDCPMVSIEDVMTIEKDAFVNSLVMQDKGNFNIETSIVDGDFQMSLRANNEKFWFAMNKQTNSNKGYRLVSKFSETEILFAENPGNEAA